MNLEIAGLRYNRAIRSRGTRPVPFTGIGVAQASQRKRDTALLSSVAIHSDECIHAIVEKRANAADVAPAAVPAR